MCNLTQNEFYFDEHTNEAIFLLSLGNLELILIFAGLLLLFLAGLWARVTIVRYLKYAAPKRPINLNFLVDQAIELPCIISITFLVFASMLARQPLTHLFGNWAEWFLYTSVIIHNLSMTIGSSGIAIYRLICVKYTWFAQDSRKAMQLMKFIIGALFSIFWPLLRTFWQ